MEANSTLSHSDEIKLKLSRREVIKHIDITSKCSSSESSSNAYEYISSVVSIDTCKKDDLLALLAVLRCRYKEKWAKASRHAADFNKQQQEWLDGPAFPFEVGSFR